MLKIRYNLITGQLSGWEDGAIELVARDGEAVEVIDISRPDVDDYEYFIYRDGKLEPSGKQPPEPSQLDKLEARVEKLEKK